MGSSVVFYSVITASDCCLTSEQSVCYIMSRTSYHSMTWCLLCTSYYIVEHPIVTVKCKTDTKTLFLYVKLFLYAMLDSLSFSFTSIFFHTNSILLFGFLVLTETTVRRQTCHATQTHLTNSEPTNLSSYALMLCSWQRNNKYLFCASLVLPDRESNPRCIVPEESTPIIAPSIGFSVVCYCYWE